MRGVESTRLLRQTDSHTDRALRIRMPCDACAANQQQLGRCICMPPLWYLFSLPDPPELFAAVSTTTTTMDKDKISQPCSKVSFPEIEIPADLIIRVGESIFPLHKAVMMPKCSYIRRAVAAATASTPKKDDDDDGDLETTTVAAAVELDLSSLPGGAEAFEKVARYCYGANFEITPHNAAALRCAAAFLDMRHPSADLARRVDDFLSRGGGGGGAGGALRSLAGAVAVLRSCEQPSLLHLADELGVARRAADAVALAVCREALFPFSSSSSSRGPGWWKAELAALSPRSFGRVVTALRCRRADPAVVAAAAASYAELVLAEVLAGPRDRADHRALLEAVVDVLPSSSTAEIPAALLCRLLHAAVATEASAKACRDLELRVAAVLDRGVTADDLLAVALDADGDRVRHADTVRRVVAAFVERHHSSSSSAAAAAAPATESERRRSRRASMSGTTAAMDEHRAGSSAAAAMEKVARMVDEVAAEMATEEALPVSKFVGVAGAVPRECRRSGTHDGLYRAVDVYLKAHPALDEIQREKVCSVMDPLRLSYQARLHAAQNKRLPLHAALTALYFDQLKLRSNDAAAAAAVPHVTVAAAAETQSSSSSTAAVAGRARAQQAQADMALARENEALRLELARMRAYMSEMQQQQHDGKGSSASPARTTAAGKKASLFGTELARVRAYVSGMHHGGHHHHHGGGKGSASTPSSPARMTAAAAAAGKSSKASSFFGSATRTLSRLNPFRGGGGGGWTAGKHAGGGGGGIAGARQCKTMDHVVTPKRRRSSIS